MDTPKGWARREGSALCPPRVGLKHERRLYEKKLGRLVENNSKKTTEENSVGFGQGHLLSSGVGWGGAWPREGKRMKGENGEFGITEENVRGRITVGTIAGSDGWGF